jgi:hypothetical protein
MQSMDPPPELRHDGPAPPEDGPAPAPPPEGPRAAVVPDAATVPRPPPDDRAVASIILGVLSVVGCLAWLGLPLGLPAILLGARAHGDIRRSAGLRAGHGLATAGIVLGSIGSTLFFAWLGIVSVAIVRTTAERALAAPPAASAAVAAPITGTDALERRTTTVPAPDDSSTHVLELHASTGPLQAQLATQALAAHRSGETLLVETTAQRCVPCAEVAAAAADTQVLQALKKVRFVRVDVGEFRDDLKGLRMSEPAVPWFYLIDVRGRPSDAISADEWDENEPGNIAPVLGAFVRGTLRSRRQSWRGETAL